MGIDVLPVHDTRKNRKFWAEEIQSLMKRQLQQQHHQQQQQQSAIPTYDNENDNLCLIFTNSCLYDLEVKHAQYQHELNMKTNLLIGYTSDVKCIIEEFVQQGLQFLRTGTDQQIALVQHDYIDNLIKRAYLAQKPNENQINIMTHLCKLKYDQEVTKHELNLLKKQMQQCQKQFDVEMKQLWKTEHTLPSEQQLTSIMRKLIDQYMTNISARMECIYKFKFDLLQKN